MEYVYILHQLYKLLIIKNSNKSFTIWLGKKIKSYIILLKIL